MINIKGQIIKLVIKDKNLVSGNCRLKDASGDKQKFIKELT